MMRPTVPAGRVSSSDPPTESGVPSEKGCSPVSFWDIVWFIFIFFAFMAYLMVIFSVIGDLFRDDSVSGWVKALWIIALIFLPFLTLLLYLIIRGRGMAERTAQNMATGSSGAG